MSLTVCPAARIGVDAARDADARYRQCGLADRAWRHSRHAFDPGADEFFGDLITINDSKGDK